jgi:hypothetical protein
MTAAGFPGEFARLERVLSSGCHFWITPAELTILAGWSRQRTHELVRSGVVTVRIIRCRDRKIVRVSANDVVSLALSRS